MSEVLLECRALSVGWSKQPVVRDLDLCLHRGEIVALLGPNGAGKTTLLLTLAGLLSRLGGVVEVAGDPVPSGDAVAMGQRGLVLVPDDRSLFRSLTVRENLAVAQRRGSRSLADILSYFPLLQSRSRMKVGQLSGGEQQMVAIGRALIRQPRLLLIDELSMGLAPLVVQDLLGLLRRVASETGTAILLVEQHAQMALKMSDRAIVLVHGEVRLCRESQMIGPDTLREAYLGGRARDQGSETPGSEP
jgi:branched-chain amino acid transport system ATP-binding protein